LRAQIENLIHELDVIKTRDPELHVLNHSLTLQNEELRKQNTELVDRLDKVEKRWRLNGTSAHVLSIKNLVKGMELRATD